MKIFSGNSTKKLSKKISKNLKKNLGKIEISRFSDGEINIQINEQIQGSKICIIQSVCQPVNDNLMELLIIIDAFKRSLAKKIFVIIPYLGYSRQDKKNDSNSSSPITAKLIANLLTVAGADYILTVDLHSEQIQGFFEIPIKNISNLNIFLKDIKKRKTENLTLVAPDIGSIKRVRNLSNLLDIKNIVIIDKYRKKANTSQVMNVIGNVNQKNCILIDDIIDTGFTMLKTVKALKNNGAKNIFIYATHPVFSRNPADIINCSDIQEIIVCDSIPLNKKIKNLKKIRVLSISNILSKEILMFT